MLDPQQNKTTCSFVGRQLDMISWSLFCHAHSRQSTAMLAEIVSNMIAWNHVMWFNILSWPFTPSRQEA